MVLGEKWSREECLLTGGACSLIPQRIYTQSSSAPRWLIPLQTLFQPPAPGSAAQRVEVEEGAGGEMQSRLPSSRGCAEKPQPWPWARVLQLAVGLAPNYTSKLSTSIRWADSIPSGLPALGIHEVPSPIGWQSRGASPAGQREKDLDSRGQAINPERRQQCVFRRCVGCAGGPTGSIVCVLLCVHYCVCVTVRALYLHPASLFRRLQMFSGP